MIKREALNLFLSGYQMRINECKTFAEQQDLYKQHLQALFEAGRITKEQLNKWS